MYGLELTYILLLAGVAFIFSFTDNDALVGLIKNVNSTNNDNSFKYAVLKQLPPSLPIDNSSQYINNIFILNIILLKYFVKIYRNI